MLMLDNLNSFCDLTFSFDPSMLAEAHFLGGFIPCTNNRWSGTGINDRTLFQLVNDQARNVAQEVPSREYLNVS